MEWVIAIIVVAALGVAALAAAGGMGQMDQEPTRDVYRQDLPERPLEADDISRLRFGVALRGYAMGQVDDILDRLAREISERDAVIAELRGSNPDAPADPEPVDPEPADPEPATPTDEWRTI